MTDETNWTAEFPTDVFGYKVVSYSFDLASLKKLCCVPFEILCIEGPF